MSASPSAALTGLAELDDAGGSGPPPPTPPPHTTVVLGSVTAQNPGIPR